MNLPANPSGVTLDAGDYPVFLTEEPGPLLRNLLREIPFSSLAVLTDTNTAVHCYPLLQAYLPAHFLVEIPAGEIHKNMDNTVKIWEALSAHGCDRKSLLLVIGGGVPGDMGGFAASVFKRGIKVVQVPTTLLSQVDASIGGKTGIDFQYFKNMIGTFFPPTAVVIWPGFFQTLPQRELESGFAEMVKHALIADREQFDSFLHSAGFPANWIPALHKSLSIKLHIVEQDPLEDNLRKGLNFGHTVGHAIETWSLEQPAPFLHGECVMAGMWCECWIAKENGLLAAEEFEKITSLLDKWIKITLPEDKLYGIARLALQDKKNAGGKILLTLVPRIGEFIINCESNVEMIEKSLRAFTARHGNP